MAKQVLTIEKLGALGDGITSEGVFVPYGLPGEEVTAEVEKGRANNVEWQRCAPERIKPVCKHFGDCGGCKVQHMAPALYADWKTALVQDALAQNGIKIDLNPIIRCAPQTRRRAVFSVIKADASIEVGFQRAGSNHVVGIDECHVLTENLFAAKPIVAGLAETFLPRAKTVAFTVLDSKSGYDIAVDGFGKLTDRDRRAISDYAMKAKIARVAVDGEVIIENRPPLLNFSGFDVRPPAGAFVQAVQSIEEAMVDLVTNHMEKCKRVADLFSGSGTFSLPLSRKSSVIASESQQASLNALDRAWREASTQGLKPIKTEKRDLHNRPFMAQELDLAKIQGVVFDPPRAGAEMQAKQLAKSKVTYVAAVSCNPITLARDLRILIDGGYRLESVTPLDQFLWSPHVEAVALLKRGKK